MMKLNRKRVIKIRVSRVLKYFLFDIYITFSLIHALSKSVKNYNKELFPEGKKFKSNSNFNHIKITNVLLSMYGCFCF